MVRRWQNGICTEFRRWLDQGKVLDIQRSDVSWTAVEEGGWGRWLETVARDGRLVNGDGHGYTLERP